MKFLEGKKTILAAVLLAAIAIAGFWYDAIPSAEAGLILAGALGLIGLGDKANRILELLAWLKTRKLAASSGQPAAEDDVDKLLRQFTGGGGAKRN